MLKGEKAAVIVRTAADYTINHMAPLLYNHSPREDIEGADADPYFCLWDGYELGPGDRCFVSECCYSPTCRIFRESQSEKNTSRFRSEF